MIVCNCRGASDREVNAAIQRGAACLSELERCGIGGDCGSCADMLREMIRRTAAIRRNAIGPVILSPA